jgi:tetratricopeptide (TPR) repeat protein
MYGQGFLARLLASVLLSVACSSQATHAQQQSTASAISPGNAECAGCHKEISASYQNTVMARASGPAAEGLVTGEFDDQVSGVKYRVFTRDNRVWMSFERQEPDKLRGERELSYFVGSGVKGRSYLFSDEGYLFESPINWYSQEGRWNMAPAYLDAQEIPLTLPSLSSCLNCHTSGLQARVPGTKNRFTGKPFLHDGITCERCHGEGDGHLTGKGPIVNPAKLPAERRDSICMECHFEGAVSVQQPGKHVYDFRPGDRLSDYIHYFVESDDRVKTAEALSQFEALSLSVCKQKSGERMWCGSCHDPHAEPAAAEKAEYYRGKCLSCHGEAFAAKHHPKQRDCRECHMKSLPSKDVAHTQATDHRILKYAMPGPIPQLEKRGEPLIAFPASDAPLVTERDYAMAWESFAERGVDGAARPAEQHLQKAVQEWPEDAEVLSAWAFVEQQHGKEKEAITYYERALKAKPLSNTAAANLGVLEAKSGDVRSAVKLWQAAFARVPYQSAIGLDLAIVFCSAGQRDVARKYVERVLEFNPDYGKAKSMLRHLNDENGQCKP